MAITKINTVVKSENRSIEISGLRGHNQVEGMRLKGAGGGGLQARLT